MSEQFLLVPLFLYAWELTVYEDWLLLGAAAGALVRFLDCGLERYYSASLRMSFAANQRSVFDRHLSTGLGIYLLISLLAGAAVTAFVILPVHSIFGLSVMSPSEASLVFWCMMFYRLVQLPRAAIKPIYAAHGDFSRGENMITLTTATYTILVALMLVSGASPGQLSIAGAVALPLLGWLPLLWDQRRRYPGIHRRPAVPTRQELSDALRKSRFYMVRDWGDILILQLPMLLIGYFAEAPGSVVIFRLTRILTGLARQMTVQLSRIGGIEMSRQLAQRDRVGLIRLYLNIGRSVGVISGLICGMTTVIAEPLIAIWTGGKAPFDPFLLYAFVAGVMIGGPGQNAIMLLTMSNLPRPLATGMLVQIALLLGLMAILIQPFGALGAAVALGFSDSMYSVWASYAAFLRFRLPEYRYAAVSFGSELAGFGASFGIGMALLSILPIQNVASLAAFCALSGTLVLPAWFFLGLSSAQRGRLLGWVLPGMRVRFRLPSGAGGG